MFLGYSSRSQEPASAIKRYLLGIGAKVLDWQTYFIPASSIRDQIDQSAARSIGGIFLFGRDDVYDDEKALPADNVVFEGRPFYRPEGQAQCTHRPRVGIEDAS